MMIHFFEKTKNLIKIIFLIIFINPTLYAEEEAQKDSFGESISNWKNGIDMKASNFRWKEIEEYPIYPGTYKNKHKLKFKFPKTLTYLPSQSRKRRLDFETAKRHKEELKVIGSYKGKSPGILAEKPGVIIGGGPVGLMIALEASRRGLPITLVQDRTKYNRFRIVELDDDTVALIREHVGKENFNSMKKNKMMWFIGPWAYISIHNLENMLAAALEDRAKISNGQIKILHGFKADLDIKTDGDCSLSVNSTENSSKLDLPKWIVATDGVRGGIAKKANMERKQLSDEVYELQIFFDNSNNYWSLFKAALIFGHNLKYYQNLEERVQVEFDISKKELDIIKSAPDQAKAALDLIQNRTLSKYLKAFTSKKARKKVLDGEVNLLGITIYQSKKAGMKIPGTDTALHLLGDTLVNTHNFTGQGINRGFRHAVKLAQLLGSKLDNDEVLSIREKWYKKSVVPKHNKHLNLYLFK